MNSLLAIDIGNTTVKFGEFQNKKLNKKLDILTTKIKKTKNIPEEYRKMLKQRKIDEIIICSVVPKITPLVVNFFDRELNLPSKVVGEDIEVPIKNLYHKPDQVGQDRLVNAFAVKKLYRVPAIIVDFGTAITFDVINKKGEYEGGIIFPGVEVSLNALIEKASLLKPIQLKEPNQIIGKTTSSSIKSGIFYGFPTMVDEMIKKLKQKINQQVIVIGTGGDIDKLKSFLKEIKVFDTNITIKGLNLLYHQRKEK